MYWVFDAAQTINLTIAGMALCGIGWICRGVWGRYKEDAKK
ncbi:hypothetical protein [Domibacillus iocasae]|nr:hypothetical protein [Domibacillus iocasae]